MVTCDAKAELELQYPSFVQFWPFESVYTRFQSQIFAEPPSGDLTWQGPEFAPISTALIIVTYLS